LYGHYGIGNGMQWNGPLALPLQTQLVQWTCNAWGWEVAAILME
jgi:hypothetical protein